MGSGRWRRTPSRPPKAAVPSCCGYGKAGITWLINSVWGQFALVRLEVLVGNKVGWRFWSSVGFEDYCVTMACRVHDGSRPVE